MQAYTCWVGRVGVSESPGKAGEGPSARGQGGAGDETSSVLGRQSLQHLQADPTLKGYERRCVLGLGQEVERRR